MITCIKSKRMIFPDGVRPGCVYLRDEKILQVDGEIPCDQVLDFGDDYVSPGFIDLHTHGALGYYFSRCTVEETEKICDFHMHHGTTTLFPTTSAAPIKEMEAAVAVLAEFMDQGTCPISIPGIHMEGPYLSLKQVGAMCPTFITPPKEEDYIPFLEQYGKYIARVTYAPENDVQQKFTKALVHYGILPSVGHSDATYEELLPAFKAGCTLVTHLYSCTSTVTRTQGFRHLGIIETAYLLDDMDIELITDGKHLPHELLRMIFKCKDHKHIALITDSISATGLEITESNAANIPYIIEDGVCKLPDRSAFAGSIATTDVLVRNALQAGCTIDDAVSMLTAVPARIMHLPKGKLESGMDADIVVFDDNITVKSVFAMGKQLV